MKLQQLRYLLAIADNGLSVTAVAHRLYTSQPGISKQLGLLEDELGMPLFLRTGRKLPGVTAFGVQVITHARVITREAMPFTQRHGNPPARNERPRLSDDSSIPRPR